MPGQKIGFIGLGKLGLDCAEVFAEHYPTCGYDIVPVESELIKIKNSIEEVVNNSDWVFIAVPTPHDKEYGGEKPSCHLEPKDFDYSIVKNVLKEINECANKSTKIVLISTVLPGTTRKELDPLLDNHTLIYNPYLIAMGTTKWDMVNPEMLIIGSKNTFDPVIDELIDLYRPMMKKDVRAETGTWEEAESIKIFYNTFISAKISLVNMIQDFAMKIGHINSDVVAGALARSTQRIMGPQYMIPGMGDAGSCHPRDNIALRWLAREYDVGYDMFETIMRAREVQAENMAKFLIDRANMNNLPIVIHGRSYKPDVPYEHGSYSLLVGHYIKKLSDVDLYYADPNTGHSLPPMKAVVLWAHNRNITYNYLDKNSLDKPYFEILPGSIIVDPWRRLNKNKDYNIIPYGNTNEQK